MTSNQTDPTVPNTWFVWMARAVAIGGATTLLLMTPPDGMNPNALALAAVTFMMAVLPSLSLVLGSEPASKRRTTLPVLPL